MTAVEIIQAIYPALYNDPTRDTHVALARDETSSTFYGTNYEKAVALLASHNYYVTVANGGNAGVQTYKMSGRMAVSYGGIGVIREYLELSNFGRQLLSLTNKTSPAASTCSDVAINYLINGNPSVFIP